MKPLEVVHQVVFEAIGTHWVIDLYAWPTNGAVAKLEAAIAHRIETFDRTYSRFRPDSVVWQLGQPTTSTPTISATSPLEKTQHLPADARPLLALYQQLYHLTAGAFTPLIGDVLAAAGYDDKYSLQSGAPHVPLAWDEVMRWQPETLTLTLHQPALLDFGAGGKGYLIDEVAAILQAAGIHEYCVDAGGDLIFNTLQHHPLRVGLEHPDHLDQVIGVAELAHHSLCGSAGNRRQWGEWHHIIHPHTVTSPRNILATWVVTDSVQLPHPTLVADALSTCLFLVPAATLQTDFAFEYLIVYADYSLEKSPQFPAEIFTSANTERHYDS